VGKFAAVQSKELYKRVVDMGIHSLQQMVLDRRKSSTSVGRFAQITVWMYLGSNTEGKKIKNKKLI
jgi:hypothetical protein